MNEATNAANEWRAYYSRFGPRLVLFARQWLPVVSDAEDAVQEAFVRFWRTRRDPDESQAGLLFAAVRHAALDQIRREARRKHRETAAVELGVHPIQYESGSPWFESAETEDSLTVQAALQQLVREQREVLVLKIWGELTFAQIGEVLDLSPNTAASRYRYAVTALRTILKPVFHE